MKTIKLLAITVVLLFSGVNMMNSQTTGLQVMQKVYDLPSGKDTQAELTMTLINKQGEKRVRQLKQYIADEGSVEKKIMYFTDRKSVV